MRSKSIQLNNWYATRTFLVRNYVFPKFYCTLHQLHPVLSQKNFVIIILILKPRPSYQFAPSTTILCLDNLFWQNETLSISCLHKMQSHTNYEEICRDLISDGKGLCLRLSQMQHFLSCVSQDLSLVKSWSDLEPGTRASCRALYMKDLYQVFIEYMIALHPLLEPSRSLGVGASYQVLCTAGCEEVSMPVLEEGMLWPWSQLGAYGGTQCFAEHPNLSVINLCFIISR